MFKDEPKWTPLKRGEETDSNPFRQDYLNHRDGTSEPLPDAQPKKDALDSVPDDQRMT